MRRQLRSMGASFDWDAEVVTCDPTYYRWNQWLFLRFLEAGLAYRATSPVDWCPNDGTLAREQVEGVDRHCWRCGARVEKRDLAQWYLRITKYADELLDFTGIDWPEPIRVMQTNWIGRSEGAEVVFRSAPDTHHRRRRRDPGLHDPPRHAVRGDVHGPRARSTRSWRPLTSPGQRGVVAAYVEQAGRATEIERLNTERDKTGVPLGADAINPVNGERIPIWIADYVLSGYGTGAIMAVPAHDERDFAFARQFGLEVREVIRPVGVVRRRGARSTRPTSRRRTTTSSSTPAATTGWRHPTRSAPSPPTSRPAARARPRSATGSATGSSAASATGARRSRSSTATAAGSCRSPTTSCRSCLPETVDYRGLGREPAQARRGVPGRRVSALRRAGPARDRHDGHVHRLVVVLVPLPLARQGGRPGRPRDARPLDAGRAVHGRRRARRHAPAVHAASSPRRWPTAASSATASRSCGSSTRARSWVPTASG